MNSLVNYGTDGDNSSESDSAKESNNNASLDDPDQLRSRASSCKSICHQIDSLKHTSSIPNQRQRNHEDRPNHPDNNKLEELIKNVDKRHGRQSKLLSRKESIDQKYRRENKDKESKSHRKEEKKAEESNTKSKVIEKKKEKIKNDADNKYQIERCRGERRDKDKKDNRDRRKDSNRVKSRGWEKVSEKKIDQDQRNYKNEKYRHQCREIRWSRDKERKRSRSRSNSRSKEEIIHHKLGFRLERQKKLEKLGIEIKTPDTISLPNQESNFYNPLAIATQGKYAEQIQKRKLLWAHKNQDEGKSVTTSASSANTWVGTTFTHDEDGKVSAKFKRLMGIKEGLPASNKPGFKPDILKKQEEMFSNMEQQYEVARATTHTQRGVGLGYASGSFQFQR